MQVAKNWMVFHDGPRGHKPKRKHPTIPEAMTEAMRLADKHKGCKFIVVEVIGAVIYDEHGFRMAEAV